MGIIQKKGIYLFEEFLDLGVYAGFTPLEKIHFVKKSFSKSVKRRSPLTGFTERGFSGEDTFADLKEVSLRLGFSFKRIVTLDQVHGSRVVSPDNDNDSLYTGDALLTQRKGVVLSVRTADCMPVFFYDKSSRSLGIIHLGWRPAKEGILDNFIDEFIKAAGKMPLGKVLLGIGPALRKCCFEVGGEFTEYSCFTSAIEKRDGRYFLDMVKFLEDKLQKRGIKYVFLDSGICSKCRKDFYSWRRDRTEKRTVSFMVNK